MDLKQNKLSKDEWEHIEKGISKNEKDIMQMIIDGFYNVDIKENKNTSFLSFLKLQYTKEREYYIYVTYFHNEIKNIINEDKIVLKKTLNKSELIRFKNTENQIERNKESIYEFVLIHFLKKIFKYRNRQEIKWNYYYYTLYHLLKNTIYSINTILLEKINVFMHEIRSEIDSLYLFQNGKKIIEENTNLFQYSDIKLYQHQREIFNKFQEYKPSLTLYVAPTGTGKTLTPLGLSVKYKIIFLCAARHVGISLAKNSINCKKKVAFAFGCDSKDDIRLHFFAAKKYSTNLKTGKIFNIDNKDGRNVDILICDSKSYLHAQDYMLEFNNKENIITYWDEPTISMDYKDHPLHEYSKNIWRMNKIPQIILSSATLPSLKEIPEVVQDFKVKFENSIAREIYSYDFKKTITILNKESEIEVPHTLYDSYEDIQKCCLHIQENKTILRYIDLGLVIDFIMLNTEIFNTIETTFNTIEKINMEEIKLYYIETLKMLTNEQWKKINKIDKTKLYPSTIKITTTDSYTLTDGPSVYFAENVEKIAKYCIHISNIPKETISRLMKTIDYNNILYDKLEKLEKSLEDKQVEDKSNKLSCDTRGGEIVKEIKKEITKIYRNIKKVELDEVYTPNTIKHMNRMNVENKKNVFRSDISEKTIENIMEIDNIDNTTKILLMMGIGIFKENMNNEYTLIMKQLAQQQKLLMVLCSTDYIYGTNYQFCHCYIGSDLSEITQDKLIQTMGRVGRTNVQQTYTIRFRNNDMIKKLFHKSDYNQEYENMKKLFNSNDIL